MNIDKIKNYNQKVLAVLGSIVVVIAVAGLVLVSFFFMNEIGGCSRNNYQHDGILSDEKIEELQKENKRKQLISYDNPRLVDTLNLVYIIPVSHKTLNTSEFIESTTLRLLDTRSSYETDSRYSRQYYGNYNNLLIFDYINHKTKKLFHERINFETIQVEHFKDDILLLLKAAAKDTNKDGVINQLDYKTLFLYALKDKELTEIKLDNSDVYDVVFVEESKDLIISFGVDYNKDGQFDQYSEPLLIKKYDYLNGKLMNIVSEDINTELQMQLDGTKK
ncbi:MAG: hypothetical protein M0Q90_16615 [Bacteroidales bacterium]|nr:hypothetical protein [Bacteroidales bacterium]